MGHDDISGQTGEAVVCQLYLSAQPRALRCGGGGTVEEQSAGRAVDQSNVRRSSGAGGPAWVCTIGIPIRTPEAGAMKSFSGCATRRPGGPAERAAAGAAGRADHVQAAGVGRRDCRRRRAATRFGRPGSRRTCRTAGYWSTRSGLPAMRRPRRRSCTTGRRSRSPLDGRVLECRRCELARHGQEAAPRTRHLRQVHQARPCAPGGLGPDGNRECVPLYTHSTDAIDEGNAGTA